MTGYRFGQAQRILWNQPALINQEIDRLRPWEMLRSGKCEEVKNKTEEWVSELINTACGIVPFLPQCRVKIAGLFEKLEPGEAPHLFPRIE